MTAPILCDYMVNQLRIEVRLPEGHWSGDVSRDRPDAVFRIEETMPLGRGRGTARLSSSSNVINELSSHSGVEEVRILGNNRYEVDIAPRGGGFIKPIRDAGVIPKSPFAVRDGWVDWTIECTPEKGKDLVQALSEQKIPYRIISTRRTNSRMLTPRQRFVFDSAMIEGYWETPRRITLTKLAKLLGVSKSTLSVHLHKIESVIINSVSEYVRRNSP
ncbi:MAG: helix-turn-helix domain-containing protein [Candidatus Poseidoniaceae archaeon]|nr:helix-turn-helix domain-containing protein [Candidatus Poseidoniaceae archaeon]